MYVRCDTGTCVMVIARGFVQTVLLLTPTANHTYGTVQSYTLPSHAAIVIICQPP